MPDDTLYRGIIYFGDTATGEEAHVAVQVAITPERTVYTIRSLATDASPVTLTSTDRAQCQFLRDLMRAMLEVSIPA